MPPMVTLIMFLRTTGDVAGDMNTFKVYSEPAMRFFVGSGMEIVTAPVSVTRGTAISATKKDLYFSTAISTTDFGSTSNIRYTALKL